MRENSKEQHKPKHTLSFAGVSKRSTSPLPARTHASETDVVLRVS